MKRRNFIAINDRSPAAKELDWLFFDWGIAGQMFYLKSVNFPFLKHRYWLS
jgi:hypothetical protein